MRVVRNKHFGFHNIIKNDGAIMFIVISTMSVLIVLATVYLLALRAETGEIIEDFSVEQTYQSAVAVNDWVFDYIALYKEKPLGNLSAESPLLQSMLFDMMVGDVLNTGVMNPISEDMGDYFIEIKLVKKTTAQNSAVLVFDITSVVQNKGNEERFTRSCEIKLNLASDSYNEERGDGYYELSFETTGGGSSSSVNMSGYVIDQPIYLGNSIKWKDGAINSNISVFGDFETIGNLQFKGTKPIEINIGGNLTHINTGKLMDCGGIIRIGGYLKTQKPITGETTFFILGDEKDGSYAFNRPSWEGHSRNLVFYINGNVRLTAPTTGCTFFINGSLEFTNSGENHGTFYVSGNVTGQNIGAGQVFYTGSSSNPTSPRFIQMPSFPWGSEAWPLEDSGITNTHPGRDFETMETARYNLLKATQDFVYDDEGNIVLDEDGNEKFTGQPKSVPVWNPVMVLEEQALNGNHEAETILNNFLTNEIDISGGDSEITITESGFIKSKISSNPGTRAIIIDTMASASNPSDPTTHKDIYIKLCANSGTKFIWKSLDWWYLNIVVRGAGKVIFFVDNGVSYAPDKFVSIAHEGWFKFLELSNTDDLNTKLNARSGAALAAIKNAVHENIDCVKEYGRDCFYCNNLDHNKTMDIYPGRFLIRQDNELNLIERFTSENVFIHQNIFITDCNENSTSRLFNKGLVYFCFIYAPFSNAEQSNSGDITYIAGGVTVAELRIPDSSSYNLKNIHIMPADYYPYKKNVVEMLVGKSKNGMVYDSSIVTQSEIESLDTIGYS